MAPPKIKLYVDTISPFGYLAYYILRHDPVFSKCEITYVPILLGGIMKACGNVPPLDIKNKSKWIEVERRRWAKTFNIPIHDGPPKGFPPRTLGIMRALAAITALHPGEEGQKLLIKSLDALFTAYWVDQKDTTDKEALAQILSDVLGKEEAGKVNEAAGKEGKQVLLENTDLAFADGAFGLPWFVATNSKGETEGFWGVDHMGQLTQHLGLDKPKTGGWGSLL